MKTELTQHLISSLWDPQEGILLKYTAYLLKFIHFIHDINFICTVSNGIISSDCLNFLDILVIFFFVFVFCFLIAR
jgi:hypothetical protein